jgi:predicted enzyme related to lactoylglutathione lyase
MLTTSKLIAFVPTRDSERARSFYEGILGLRVAGDDQFALVLDSNDIMVRVAKVQDFVPAPYTVLGWEVSDIQTVASNLVTRGVTFERYEGMDQDSLGIWTTPNGSRIAWFKYPDGNVLSLSEF